MEKTRKTKTRWKITMKKICKIVLCLVLLLLVISLFGCSKTATPTDIVADNAKKTIHAIVEAKPECKGVGDACDAQIESVRESCALNTDKITEEKIKWKISFWFLVAVIGAYVAKKLFICKYYKLKIFLIIILHILVTYILGIIIILGE